VLFSVIGIERRQELQRFVIHLNVADFAVAVERVVDPRLARRPVIVAPQASARSLVYDMSDEAYREGVRKGMPLSRARRMLRSARFLPPNPHLYERAMRAALKLALPYSPLVEGGEMDGHLFVDATGMSKIFGPPRDMAHRIRREMNSRLRLDPVWSVASNKLVAKVATRLVKPAGECIVEPGEEESFLRPLPIRILPGVESGDLERLGELNLSLIGDLSRLSVSQLELLLGERAQTLYEKAHGIDRSIVPAAGSGRPVVENDHCFEEDTNDAALVEAVLYRCVERAGFELRSRRLAAKSVTVTIDYSDGIRVLKNVFARIASSSDAGLFALAETALEKSWRRRVRLRRLRLTCCRLFRADAQLSLFENESRTFKAATGIDSALDSVRRRFGASSVFMGRGFHLLTPPVAGNNMLAQCRVGTDDMLAQIQRAAW